MINYTTYINIYFRLPLLTSTKENIYKIKSYQIKIKNNFKHLKIIY